MSNTDINDLLDPPKRKRTDFSRVPWGDIPDNAVKQLISRLGGPVPAAEKIGVTRQSIYLWVRQGYVPAVRAFELEKKFGATRSKIMSPKDAALFK